MRDGSLVVGGKFTYAGGQQVNNVAQWTGTAWQPLASGVFPTAFGGVYSLLELANGDLLVGGDIVGSQTVNSRGVVRWNGSAWSGLGVGIPVVYGANVGVWALAESRNGDVFAGGKFSQVDGAPSDNVARWNGTAWVAMGTGVGLVGNDVLAALTVLPDGDVVAGGLITSAGGAAAAGVARWDGAVWSPFGTGVPVSLPQTVRSLGWLPEGRLAVGGTFAIAGGLVSPHLAYIASSCPATITAYGTGCPGSGGLLQVVGVAGPWLGGTMRTEASGLLPGSLVARALGFAALALPLAALHPTGGAGCSLLVDPVVVDVVLPPHGAVLPFALQIPLAGALVGVTVREQVVEFELAALGSITRVSSTNALLATLGWF
ncbi:MAG: hypothetical protein JNK15_18160 [Planctomycetes bacterium]|nr:hypothetical protein [Planctomycetota bacterium]